MQVGQPDVGLAVEVQVEAAHLPHVQQAVLVRVARDLDHEVVEGGENALGVPERAESQVRALAHLEHRREQHARAGCVVAAVVLEARVVAQGRQVVVPRCGIGLSLVGARQLVAVPPAPPPSRVAARGGVPAGLHPVGVPGQHPRALDVGLGAVDEQGGVRVAGIDGVGERSDLDVVDEDPFVPVEEAVDGVEAEADGDGLSRVAGEVDVVALPDGRRAVLHREARSLRARRRGARGVAEPAVLSADGHPRVVGRGEGGGSDQLVEDPVRHVAPVPEDLLLLGLHGRRGQESEGREHGRGEQGRGAATRSHRSSSAPAVPGGQRRVGRLAASATARPNPSSAEVAGSGTRAASPE